MKSGVKLISAVILFFIAGSATSCTKCYVCDFGTGGEQEFCRKDYEGDKSMLDQAIREYEDAGYTCSAK